MLGTVRMQVTAQQQQQQDSSSAHQPGSVPVRFMLQRELPFGQSHVVVGSHSFLGAWDLKSAAQMTWGEDHIWQAEVFLPTGTSTEFKVRTRRQQGCPLLTVEVRAHRR